MKWIMHTFSCILFVILFINYWYLWTTYSNQTQVTKHNLDSDCKPINTLSNQTSHDNEIPTNRTETINATYKNCVSNFIAQNLTPAIRLNYILFHLRIPKTGSSTMQILLDRLSYKFEGFSHIRFPNYRTKTINGVSLAVPKINYLTDFALSASQCGFSRVAISGHFHYFDIMKQLEELPSDSKRPIWFTVVRDPVELIISKFYFSRQRRHMTYSGNKIRMKPGEFEQWLNTTFDECILNRLSECRFHSGSLVSFLNGEKNAIKAVQRDFPVVGVLEHLNETLAVIQNNLPHFFKGVTKQFKEHPEENVVNAGLKKTKVSEEAKSELRKMIAADLNFYQYLKSRLMSQYEKISPSA